MEIVLMSDRDEFEKSLSGLRAFRHSIARTPLAVNARPDGSGADAFVVDAVCNGPTARESCNRLGAWAPSAIVLAVVADENLAVAGLDWHVDDFLVATAGTTEADARLRLAQARRRESAHEILQFGPLVLRQDSFTASLANRELDLTLTEFKLLSYLVQHAGQAFTRTRLLREIWGGDGGRRKVDVHVQRLRAKLGSDHDSIVDTVRGVGYMTPEPSQPPPWAVAN